MTDNKPQESSLSMQDTGLDLGCLSEIDLAGVGAQFSADNSRSRVDMDQPW
jgi:hypothetical protein